MSKNNVKDCTLNTLKKDQDSEYFRKRFVNTVLNLSILCPRELNSVGMDNA